MVNILNGRYHMLNKNRMVLVALGFVCAGVTSAEADMCITTEGGGGTTVGESFTLPLPNRCKPFNGFEDGGLAGAIDGVGCTDRNGGTFILHYTYHNSFEFSPGTGSYFETGFCRFQHGGVPLPAAGTCRGTVLTTPDNHGSFNQRATIFRCVRDVPENLGP
jgi:hypothetical protein